MDDLSSIACQVIFVFNVTLLNEHPESAQSLGPALLTWKYKFLYFI